MEDPDRFNLWDAEWEAVGREPKISATTCKAMRFEQLPSEDYVLQLLAANVTMHSSLHLPGGASNVHRS